ncbi:MAG: hypothetical protein FJ316_10415 [SAR202 cluster bacterium]|nr:hypothetical protein [SAR202 cluster bacterium]
MDTYIGRRNTSRYQVVRQDGWEILVSPDLARHTRRMFIHLKRFLFWQRLQAEVELQDGAVLERA